jgi:hypothetical protein
MLDSCDTVIRCGLLKNFKKRFSGMTIDVLWTTILDPRCRSMKHLTHKEREIARKRLIDQVFEIPTMKSEEYSRGMASTNDGGGKQKAQNFVYSFDIFDSPVVSASEKRFGHG